MINILVVNVAITHNWFYFISEENVLKSLLLAVSYKRSFTLCRKCKLKQLFVLKMH